MAKKLESWTDEELLEEFRRQFIRADDAMERLDLRVQKRAMKRSIAISHELHRRGQETMNKLLPLLHDEHERIRLAAAARALEFRPDLAEPVLRKIDEHGATPEHQMIAWATLREWRAGLLKFPI